MDHTPLSIHREEIKQVTSYKYLGIHLDNLFSWSDHIDCVCSCLNQRLYFLHRLRVFGVSQKVMFLFYQAVMEVQTAVKVKGRTDKLSLQSIYEQSVLRQAQRVSDLSQIPQTDYELLPPGRRYRIPKCKFNHFTADVKMIGLRSTFKIADPD